MTVTIKNGSLFRLHRNVTFMREPGLGSDYGPTNVDKNAIVVYLGAEITVIAYDRPDTFFKFLTPGGVMWLHSSWMQNDFPWMAEVAP